MLADSRSVLIPFDSRLEYYLQLPPEGALTAEKAWWLGEGGGRLELLLEEEGRSPTHLATLDERAEGLEVPIRSTAPRIARLTLRADRRLPSSDSRSGVVLVEPALRVLPSAPDSTDRRAAAEASNPPDERPNILPYVVDTLRADHLGVDGYSKPVSPHLDRFAADATVSDNVVAQSSWTRAAMASIFTGLWPVKHAANGRKDILDPAPETLTEILQAAGYVTVARVRNWNVFPIFGFRQGFEDLIAVDRGKADRMNPLVRQWRGMWVREVVQHIDLTATILDYASVPIPAQVEGRPLLPLLEPAGEQEAVEARPAFSFLHLDGLPHRSLVEGGWKLIERLTPEGRVLWAGLFHRRDDPFDALNRAREYPI